MISHGGGAGRVAGLLCAAVVAAGCQASARHARPSDTGIPVPLGSGLQGAADDPRCQEARYVAVCGRAARLDDVVGGESDHFQVERRSVVVAADEIRLTGHYRSGDKSPDQLMGDYEYALERNGWTVTRPERMLTAKGSGDYAGWVLTLRFTWTGSAIKRAEVDVRESATAPLPA